MKCLIVMMLSLLSISSSSVGCARQNSRIMSNVNRESNVGNSANTQKERKMKIRIGSKTFDATLFDNETAAAFKALLPLTVDMEELNGNEKKYDLSKLLPTNSFKPNTINRGDLLFWEVRTWWLFYKNFRSSNSKTSLEQSKVPSESEVPVASGMVEF